MILVAQYLHSWQSTHRKQRLPEVTEKVPCADDEGVKFLLKTITIYICQSISSSHLDLIKPKVNGPCFLLIPSVFTVSNHCTNVKISYFSVL